MRPASRAWYGEGRRPRRPTARGNHVASVIARELRIQVMVDATSGYGRGVLRGVSVFGRNRPHWRVEMLAVNSQMTPQFTRAYDGLILQAFSTRISDEAARTRIAVVNVGDATTGHAVPTVISDHLRIGALAAEAFLDRGFRQLAFLGEEGRFYAQRRFEGLRRRASEAGLKVEALWAPGEGLNDAALAQWLLAQPRPIGLAACHDGHARRAAQVCRAAGLKVPRDVAIVGVDNDELVCELGDPPLSSVAVAAERIGYEAAALLERLMDGEQPSAHVGLVPPIGIVRRRSSDVLASDNPVVNEAAAFIWRFATRPIGVDDVAEHVGISRRSLEQHFETSLGRTPVSVMRQARLERIKDLLVSTDMPLSRIAEAAGLADSASLSRFFRRETGQTPSQFRRRSRLE